MAIDITYRTGNDITVTDTETTLATNDGSTSLNTMTDDGMYTLILDGKSSGTLPMVKGDQYLVRVYEKAETNASKQILMSPTLSDAQSELFIIPMLPLGIGWDITLQRISATSRKFYWTIRRVS